MSDFKSAAANDIELLDHLSMLPETGTYTPADVESHTAMAAISPEMKLPAVAQGFLKVMNRDLHDTPMGWVNACLSGSYEAMIAVLEEPCTKEWDEEERMMEAKQAAASTYLLLMPTIISKRRAQCFIACAAAAQQHGYISGEKARALLYTAQLAISAYGKPSVRRSHEPRAAGGNSGGAD